MRSSTKLRPYTHFLTPNGKGSVVEEGPWSYGADYIVVYFKADREKIAKLVPKSLEVLDGSASAYVADIVGVSEKNPDSYFLDPGQTVYHEAGITVACKYGDKKGFFAPCMWVDNDTSFIRGWINGHPKKLADRILATHLHPLNPLVGGARPGVSMSGFCTRHGERLLSLQIELETKGIQSDLANFGVPFALRHFPTTHESQTDVNELVELMRYNARVEDVWMGRGSLKLGSSQSEELEFIEPLEVTKGVTYRTGFTIGGARVLERL
jgi:acetoacetate decarboxylase